MTPTATALLTLFLSTSQAAKGGPFAIAKALKGLKLKDLIPEAPAIANYTTGASCCLLLFGIYPL